MRGPDLGNWCQKTRGKARWYVPGSRSTTERSPGPLSCPFPVCLRQGGGVGGRGDTRLMVSETGGQPPTRPITLLQRLPQPGSARREAEKDSGKRGRPTLACPGEPGCLIPGSPACRQTSTRVCLSSCCGPRDDPPWHAELSTAGAKGEQVGREAKKDRTLSGSPSVQSSCFQVCRGYFFHFDVFS